MTADHGRPDRPRRRARLDAGRLEDVERVMSLALAGVPAELSVRAATSQDWFTETLKHATSDTERLCAWAVLALEAGRTLLDVGQLDACRALVRSGLPLARDLLGAGLSPTRHGDMLLCALGLMGTLGTVGARRGHRLAMAAAAGAMIDLWNERGPGGEATVAIRVERALRSLLDAGRVFYASVLLARVPEAVARAHGDWKGVEDHVATYAKHAADEPRSLDDIAATVRRDLRRMLDVDDARASDLAKRFLDLVGSEGPTDATVLREIVAGMQKLAVELGDREPGPPLEIEVIDLLRAALDGAPAEALGKVPQVAAIERSFEKANDWENVATTRLALARLNDHAGRAEAAIEWHVRAIEAQTRLAADPRLPPLTAGITESLRPYYSHLIDALCDVGRFREALLAAEHCKGFTWRRTRDAAPTGLAALLDGAISQSLPPGLLSYFVEDRGVTVFRVDRRGVARATRMAITRDRLEAVVAHVRPNGWRRAGLFEPSNARAIRLLSPLVASLANIDAGEAGAALVISPDGILHNVPWHLLRIEGEPLIERFGPRTVICLDHWRHTAGKVPRPSRKAALISVPTLGEHEEDRWQTWHQTLGDRFTCSTDEFSGFFGEEGTVQAFADGLSSDLLHVRCHGDFPATRTVTASDAYRRSGLLLARDGLPLRSPHAVSLTPERLLAMGMPAGDRIGTVCLEACVSGVVHDGAAGDPISMPWVLALLGAEAIVASQWDVDTRHAEAFFETFYRASLKEEQGAGEAYRIASRAVIEKFGPAAAGFRLLGG